MTSAPDAEVDFDRLRDRLAHGAPFVELLGVELRSIGPGSSIVGLAIGPSLTNGMGTVHAGALFSCADVAAGAAAYGLLATVARLGEVALVTSRAEIDFRQPATGDLVVRATVHGPHDDLLDPWHRGRSVRLPVVVRLEPAGAVPDGPLDVDGSGSAAIGAATFTCVARRAT